MKNPYDENRRRYGPGAHRALGVLFLVALVNYVDRALLSVLQVPIKAELGLSDAELGALTGLSFALFYAAAAIPLSRLIDRYHRIWIITGCLILWTSMTALTSLAWGFVSLIVLRIGVAIGEAGSVPGTHSLLSDYYPRERRGTVFSIWAFASPVGVMIGLAAGGLLSEQLGWRNSFLLIGLGGFGLVPLLLALKEPRRGGLEEASAAPAAADIPFMQGLAAVWGNRTLRLLVLGTTLHAFSYMTIMNWTPPLLSRSFDMPLGEVAIWAGLLFGVGGGIGALSGGTIVDMLARRHARWYGLAPCFAIGAVVPISLIQYWASSTMIALVSGFLSIMFAAFYIAPVNALAQSMVSPRMRGFMAAILLVFPTIFGTGAGPFVTGVISDLLLPTWGEAGALKLAMSFSLAGSIGAAIVFFRLSRTVSADLTAMSVSTPGR